MRKSDMIAYMVPVRRFGEYHMAQTKAYIWIYREGGKTFTFGIRKGDTGKGYQVDEYHTGLKVGGNYGSIRSAAASIIFMIKYHDLLGTIRRTHQIKLMRDGQLLNPVSPAETFPECCYPLNENTMKEGDNAVKEP